jgi:hypothetical protein
MGGEGSTHGDVRYLYRISIGKPERNNLGDLGLVGG